MPTDPPANATGERTVSGSEAEFPTDPVGRRRGLAWAALRWAVSAVVLAAVIAVFLHSFRQLDRTEITWRPIWILIAAGLYMGSLFPWALFWFVALRALGQRPGWFTAIRAYYIGHLGKYVPGKALVVVLRTALVRGPSVATGAAAAAAIYETLVTMATGALVAAATSLFWLGNDTSRTGAALVLLMVAGVPLLPWVFNPLVQWLGRRFSGKAQATLPRLRFRTLLVGTLLGMVGWCGIGISVWAGACAVWEMPMQWSAWLMCTSAMCIALVVGFVSPAPGGLGVREGVLMGMLTPSMGAARASLVAILLRLGWIAAEASVAAVLYCLPLIWSRRRGCGETGVPSDAVANP